MSYTHTALLTSVPEQFFPAIGSVMLSHAFMDRNLQTAICVLAGMDYSAGVSFLSEINMTSKRAGIFKNLARTKEGDLSQLTKMLVLGDAVVDLSVERNIVAHSLPYWRSGDGSEIGYFKEENKTSPQIAVNPPYRATVAKLNDLSTRIQTAGIWLGMLQPMYLPDGVMREGMNADEAFAVMKKHGQRNPLWYEDAKFPWLDKFNAKLEKERRKPQNSKRVNTKENTGS